MITMTMKMITVTIWKMITMKVKNDKNDDEQWQKGTASRNNIYNESFNSNPLLTMPTIL